MTDEEKWNRALMIAIEDLDRPNEATRAKAIEEKVFVEFYEIRQQLIEHAHRKFTFRNSKQN